MIYRNYHGAPIIKIMNKILAKDLKKNIEYRLTADFDYPYTNAIVKLVKFIPAKEIFPYCRGNAAKIKTIDGDILYIRPYHYLVIND